MQGLELVNKRIHKVYQGRMHVWDFFSQKGWGILVGRVLSTGKEAGGE